MPKRVGFLGPAGTFTEQAMLAFFAGEEIIPLAYPDLPAVLEALAQEEIAAGVVPWENSLEGSVTLFLDLLVKTAGIYVVGEVVLPIVHHLLARPGVSSFTRILSHPHALAQCREFLRIHFPDVPLFPTGSTAEAARLVAESSEPWAAVGPETAAKNWGLVVVKKAIQDSKENETRFAVLGKERAPRTGRDKTSVAFALTEDRPGVLYKALEEFARREINLTKIESRPAKRQLGQYIFFLDCEGHMEDPEVRAALEALKAQSSFFKILGSYPRWGGS
ncbi:Prephenate dehydratase [Ammonifex degensii KC4]|uniref:Prephenate dehydratase n=1 Tax=Ammonifex degensii (strain DSM 10501 / KC4) TaxID=429009 RepID=C9RDE3_AMMDK|nr:prephenate dehydratase [Ammonifex degensii]ACX52270.1 Prephenate dehydratase [Ammonifex degensii KC4]